MCRNSRTFSHHFFVPASLELAPYFDLIPQAAVERFNDAYFTGIPGYNRLMLSLDFYRRFAGFTHILIYQPDAYVFRDELEQWCNAGYDYIGGPYSSPYRSGTPLLPGNGGLSLRKVQSCIELLTPRRGVMFRPERLRFFASNNLSFPGRFYAWIRSKIPYFNSYSAMLNHFSTGKYNEDCVFFEFSSTNSHTNFQMAPLELSYRFSWDALPADRPKLPFGCHGWIKNAMLREIIQREEKS